MQPNAIPVPDDLNLRPVRPDDSDFLEALYSSTRDDLRQINAENGFIEELIRMQHALQMQGNEAHYPNALQLVVEKLGERIGRIIVDFGRDEIKILSIAFMSAERGKGYGSGILRGLQRAASDMRTPLVLDVMRDNLKAKQLYQRLGFSVEHRGPIEERMVWRPGTDFLR
ncbi:MAG: GNAT family N-acetyltransferase [Methylococcaceae bacterium]|nr:GNAT family N-acetyltransferase [Methylococcaceae bacterium]